MPDRYSYSKFAGLVEVSQASGLLLSELPSDVLVTEFDDEGGAIPDLLLLQDLGAGCSVLLVASV